MQTDATRRARPACARSQSASATGIGAPLLPPGTTTVSAPASELGQAAGRDQAAARWRW